MPIYEYHCQQCGEGFEKLTHFLQADEQHVCPSCGSDETIRKLSTIASFGSTSNSTAASGCSSNGPFT